MDKLNPHIAEAIDIFGSQKKLADAIGCSQQNVSLMLRGIVKISAENAASLHSATRGRISKRKVRPDVFGHSPQQEASA